MMVGVCVQATDGRLLRLRHPIIAHPLVPCLAVHFAAGIVLLITLTEIVSTSCYKQVDESGRPSLILEEKVGAVHSKTVLAGFSESESFYCL